MSHQNTLDLAVIGNCTNAALVDTKAAIKWACLPYLDGDPVFCALVDEPENRKNDKRNDTDPETRGDVHGVWDFKIENFSSSRQSCVSETPVVETFLTNEQGDSVKIIDFIPRIKSGEINESPPLICRIVEPVKGTDRKSVV